MTNSTNLPSVNPYQAAFGGSWDVFIAQFSNNGTQLLYSSYLGGPLDDRGLAVETLSSAVVAIAGTTRWGGFPTTAGAFQTRVAGASDVFVMTMSTLVPAGSQIFAATLLGGSGPESVPLNNNNGDWDYVDLAVEPGGGITVVGPTGSRNLPTTTGAYQTAHAGGSFRDALIAQFDASLSTLRYCTYLGGTADDVPWEVVVDRNGDVALCGLSWSLDYPTTTGAYQPAHGYYAAPNNDGFIAVLRPTGQGVQDLRYATMLGGSNNDTLWGIAVESSGILLVCGFSDSGLVPTAGALQTTQAGSGILARVDPANGGTTDMHYLSYFGAGGPGGDWCFGLQPTGTGPVIFGGFTQAAGFPVTAGAYQTTFGGGLWDVFLARVDMLPGNVTRLGGGMPACLGPIDMQVNQMPAPGAVGFELIANDAPPGGAGVLVIGAPLAAPVPFLGAQLLVLPQLALPVLAGNGFVRTRLPIPAGVVLSGTLGSQYGFLTTPTCPGPGTLATSDALLL